MSVDAIWLIICGAGAIQSVFLSVYILSSKRIELDEKMLLGMLLLAISLRLIKSIGWFFFEINDTIFLNMGFVAHGFIGPLLVLYLWTILSRKNIFLRTKLLVLFPAIVLLLSSPFIDLNNFWYAGGYQALLYMTVLYLGWATLLVLRLFRKQTVNFSWIRNLFFSISLFCISYFTNYALGLNSYILGPVVYSMIIYLISFIVFSNHEIFSPKNGQRKYRNLNLSTEQIERQKEKIEQIMKERAPYLNKDFNLTKLSEMTSIPKYMLSRLFSENMNQNFSEFINNYRVEKAKELLVDASHQNHKIAFIAYDCGFHSLSSFNTAFKKVTSTSPSEYRKNNIHN